MVVQPLWARYLLRQGKRKEGGEGEGRSGKSAFYGREGVRGGGGALGKVPVVTGKKEAGKALWQGGGGPARQAELLALLINCQSPFVKQSHNTDLHAVLSAASAPATVASLSPTLKPTRIPSTLT